MPGKEEVKDEVKIPEEAPEKIPEGYTPEEWADLSPTEKEGIVSSIEEPEGDEIEEEEIDEESLKEIAGEEEEEEPGKKPEEKPKREEKPAEVTAPEGKPPEEKPAEKPIEKPPEPGARLSDDDLVDFRPVVSEAELPAVDNVPAEIQTKLDDLDKKYDDGEIDLKAYNKERDALNRQVTMHNISEREQRKTDIIWQKEQQYFLQNRPEYLGTLGADGKFQPTRKSIALFGALRETVNSLGKDPKNANLSGIELMLMADKAVREDFGIGGTPAPTPKPKAEGKPPAPRPDHKTLTDVPPAAPNTTESAFATLDKLHGEAYEAALERLTPAQRSQYEDDLARGRRT